MALTFGWKGAADTDLAFSEFFGGDHTLVLWFLLQYPRAYAGPFAAVNGTGTYLVGQGDFNTQGGPSGQAHLIARVTGANGVVLPASLDAGVWRHMAVVRTGAQIQVFLDGQPAGGPLAVATTGVPAGTLRLGRPAPGAGVDGQEAQLYGMLDEVAVFSRALPIAEIQARFATRALLTGLENGLVAGWTFSPTPAATPPARLARPVVRSGETAVVPTTWTVADLAAIPLPRNDRQELPFLSGEAWLCAQGTAATFSHRGYAAFCWDFVVADTGGAWTDVYPNGSFQAPVFSVGEGETLTVSDVSPPASATEKETENQVLVRGEDGLIRAYLHLLKNTALPYEGQKLYDGQPVAKISTEWRDPNRPIPHFHFATQPDASDMAGFVTVPTAFSDYEVRNPDGSWSFVPRGIPALGQVVRRTGRRLWVVNARAGSYSLLTPPLVAFSVISQTPATKTYATIEVRPDGGTFHVLRSEDFMGVVPAAFVGLWNARRVGANTRDPVLLVWLGRTAGPSFFDRNGRFEFRIRLSDEDGAQSDPVSVFATIRWHGQRVTCIRHQGSRITAIGGDDADRGRWQLGLAAAIQEIGRGQRFYVEEPTGDRVDVVLAQRANGVTYLKTVADGDRPNNLLSLQRCP